VSIDHVSDTARWVAVYRARESERPDALFRDPWAARLAGEKGLAVTREMNRGADAGWAIAVRTAVLDEVILDAVHHRGADLVVNLAAGLDARPWRLDLPAALRWADVDHPGILAHKAAVLGAAAPRCRYEAVAADLADGAERAAALSRLTAGSRFALVVTEGLLVYLAPGDVAALARDLHAQPAVRRWVTDLASPRLLGWMRRRWGRQVGRGNAPFRFGPAEGPGFFAPHGWREAAWRGTFAEARRLNRPMPWMWTWHPLLRVAPAPLRRLMDRFSGYLVLERAGEPPGGGEGGG
jgi:methyltransferase (TIGR00027 family)